MSDHSVLLFSLQSDTGRVISKDKFKWDKGDYNKLQDFLSINWDDALDVPNGTVDEMWETFKQIMLDGMNKS